MLPQSFVGAYKGRVYMRMFIGVSVRSCVSSAFCTSMSDTDRMPMVTLGQHAGRCQSAARGWRTPTGPHILLPKFTW